MKYKAVPEWEEPKEIFIVNPEVEFFPPKYSANSILVKLYDEFLYYLIDYTTINVIVNDAIINVDFSVPFEKVNVLYMPAVKNIWIRDWAPISVKDKSGRITAVKFKYSPSYLAKSEANKCNKSGKLLAQLLKLPLIEIPLILDGGNFTHNGEGIGIVTNRIISDNENYSIEEIKDFFYQYLGIWKLIFIPVEPGDETGHTDVMVRFMNRGTLIVGAYLEEYKNEDCLIPSYEAKESAIFMNKLAGMLQEKLGYKYKTVRITNSVPRKPKNKNDVAPAFGNYINFVRLGKYILLPQYKIPEDEIAENVFKKNFPNLEIIPVNISGIKELSEQGGVLNCISWVKY